MKKLNVSEPVEAPVEAEAPAEVAAEAPAEVPEEEKAEEPVEAPAEEKAEEPEPQKPVLETPSELLGDMPTGEKSAEEAPVEAEKPAEEAPAEPETPAEPEMPAEPEAPAESEAPTEPEPAPEVKVETPELPKATGPAPEDTTHKSVKLQPSAEAQAELEAMMKEEPKKNELLAEMNKESERLAAGGLRPDVGLSSIDTDSIGKSEVKDYSELMAAALNGDDGMPNPAVQAAPDVAAGPNADENVPEMDYSQPTDAPAEQPPVMQNGMLEPVAPATEPVGAAHEGMMTATDVAAPNNPGVVAASEGMNGDILPPPPAPPVDGSMMPPTAAPEAALAAPAMPEMPAPAAAPAAPASPEPITTPSSAMPVTPVIPAAPAAPVAPAAPEAAPTQVGPTPTNDDPSAFRIPGM